VCDACTDTVHSAATVMTVTLSHVLHFTLLILILIRSSFRTLQQAQDRPPSRQKDSSTHAMQAFSAQLDLVLNEADIKVRPIAPPLVVHPA